MEQLLVHGSGVRLELPTSQKNHDLVPHVVPALIGAKACRHVGVRHQPALVESYGSQSPADMRNLEDPECQELP